MVQIKNTSLSTKTRANMLLLITAVIWGGGFVAQRLGMQELGPYIFNGFRFLLGALTLLPIIIIRNKKNPIAVPGYKKLSAWDVWQDCSLELLFSSLD